MVAVYANGDRLQTQNNAGGKPLFYGASVQETSPAIVPLYEYTNGTKVLYSTDPNLPGAGLTRTAAPLCRVWRNPSRVMNLDAGVQALGE